jgi:hypothetical protein
MHFGTLTIKDRTFSVTFAKLKIAEGATAEWWIDIHTAGRSFDGEEWTPRLYGEGIPLGCSRDAIKKGRKFEVPVWYDEDTQEHLFTLYVFEHAGTYQNRIEVTEASASEIKIAWTGLCDVFWGDDYSDGLPFECETWLELEK